MNNNWATMKVKDVAVVVQGTLSKYGIDSTLVGGACVEIYSNNKYSSGDIDIVSDWPLGEIENALTEIGFKRKDKTRFFEKKDCEYFLDFVQPPLAIGNAPVKQLSIIKTRKGMIKLLTPSDCVKDRLAAYFYWDDKQSLEQAILVAKTKTLDYKSIEKWAKGESNLKKYREFISRAKKITKTRNICVFLTAVLGCLLCVSNIAGETGSKDGKKAPNEYWQKQIEKFEKKYKITVDYKKLFYNSSGVNGEKALDSQLAVYVPMLMSEFSIYPPALFESSMMKKIVLCRNMKNNENQRLGYALFMRGNNAFFQNVGELDTFNHIRLTVHHEFFHSLDELKGEEEEEWEKLNPKDFKYFCRFGIGEEFLDKIAKDRQNKKPFSGFITRYSQANAKEDRAEIFCHMVFYPEVIKKKSKNDPVIAAKIKYIKALLSKMCKEMDDGFWEMAEKRQVWKMSSYSRGEYYQYIGDYKNAFKYFKKAAEDDPEKPETDEFYTEEWYKNSSELAKTLSEYEVGQYLFDDRNGDNQEAVSWIKKSAGKGYVDAQIFLGQMYEEGLSVKKDINEAKKWYSLAEKQGSKKASVLLNNLLYEK
ncbi:MAG: hypothetical protein A2452_09495 [Candidatus Firestonebacteria bacterium RIFOXYC2_FULL_39_67]|nr:MAG: hypothetical protein A2536_00085 [Candidatus Firestonebacteria bacterium RIFOXYD2_FULL_39_29]OGF52923.1 MAG: hypothetical protein A2497_00340 [Candidatus Firestonebacteria bacterium RifOxyC12_full_39_7]OGF55746.1 MAG: hypothetical protein A2452_09495 [Candidatus Firestonebacteria bacterium RIFOXYC2_FULL_39_67]